MAKHNCSVCEDREANYMVSSLADGQTTMICIPCLPGFTVAVFETVGLPGLQFDFPDETLADADEGLVPDLTEGEPDEVPFQATPDSELSDDEWMASALTVPPADD